MVSYVFVIVCMPICTHVRRCVFVDELSTDLSSFLWEGANLSSSRGVMDTTL